MRDGQGRESRSRRLPATRGQQRTNVTYVATISDNAELNRRLPQVVIGNARVFKKGIFERLWTECRNPFYLLSLDKAWMNGETLVKIGKLLMTICLGFDALGVFCLVLDCAPSHMLPWVVKALRRLGLEFIFIPALCTWLFQPLDVYVFRIFKVVLRRLWRQAAYQAHSTNFDPSAFLKQIYAAHAEVFLARDWPYVFSHLGLVAGQAEVRLALLSEMGLSVPPQCSANALSDEDVISILPRNRRQVSAADLFAEPRPAL